MSTWVVYVTIKKQTAVGPTISMLRSSQVTRMFLHYPNFKSPAIIASQDGSTTPAQ